MISAEVGITSVTVEVFAVVSRVAENAVEHNFYAEPVSFFAKRRKILFGSEKRINIFVVRRVVSVIALSLENRIEVDAGNAELLQISELFLYALEIAAEIVVVENLAVGRRYPEWIAVPVRAQNPVGRDVFLFPARESKTVGENLIDHAALESVGGAKVFIVDGELPVVALALNGGNAVADRVNSACTPRGVVFKVVFVDCGFFCGEINLPPLFAAALHTVPLHIKAAILLILSLFYNQLCRVTAKITGQNNAKRHGLIGFYCPEYALVIFKS